MKKLYRMPKKAAVTGVLAGTASYLDMDVTVIRLLFIVGLIITGFFPLVVIYFIAHLLLPVKGDDNVIDGKVE